MVRRVAWLGLLCACTQDFSVFDPADDSSVPNDGSNDSSVVDVSTPDVKPTDASTTPDVKDAVSEDVGIVDAPPDVVVPCTETGAIMYGGHCYFLVTTTQTQAAASTGCTNAGAHLVTITTSGEQAAVIVLGATTERWTGLVHNGVPVKDSNYSWANGEARNGFSAWSPGEPNGTGQCGSLLGTGLWNDQDCSISLASICERQ